MNKYKAYTLQNFLEIPRIANLPEQQKFAMKVVAHVLPFRCNNYVVEELINWDDIPNDPMFVLTFPQKDMLKPHNFSQMADALKSGASKQQIKEVANQIRMQLNPHPAGQMHNIPMFEGHHLEGMQHKYRETVLFFPSESQTCHAYCSFCFRWPQFVGLNEMKFAMREVDLLIEYVRQHESITDILFTGGDPLIMRTRKLAFYIEPLLEANIPHLRTIRIGTKALGYWPYRFLTDRDADDLLRLFEKVVKADKHLSIMAHVNHHAELKPKAAQKAIHRIRNTGAQIRTQSPLLAHINNDPDMWAEMWREQVHLGLIPYYMFVVRDTGAQHYFGIPLVQAWQTFRKAYQQISGICRTVRGPSMSANPGKVHILGVPEVKGEKVIALQFIQARNPAWVGRPFFAKYNEKAIWLDELEPAFGKKKFFFEK